MFSAIGRLGMGERVPASMRRAIARTMLAGDG
jgi:hypothetical protein